MRTDKRFSKKAPSRAPKRGVVGFSKKTALLEEAVTQMNAGKYGRSSSVLKELLALDPQNLEARRLFATLHLRLGSLMTARTAFESLAMEALQRQDYWLAESLLREYLAAGPRCVPFLELLGHVYEEKGDPMAAVAEYGKAIEVLVEDPDPDRPQRAAELYAKVRELAPASPVAFRLAPMFDARTGELAVMPYVRAPGESADGSETQSNVSSFRKEISPNDAPIRLPWETADDEAKSASCAEGELDGSPVVENSQESTSSPERGSSEGKPDEGWSVPVTFASQGVAASDSKRVGSTPSEDMASLRARGDESLFHDTVLTTDTQPTAPTREELAGYEPPSPVDETTSPPVTSRLSTTPVESQGVEHVTMAQPPGSSFIIDEPISMPVLEATTQPAAGADTLAAPMPWEQAEETTVTILQPEPVTDDSAQQETEAAPPTDEAVRIPPPRESDPGIHAEIRTPPPLEWETPTTENRADAPSRHAAGEQASPVPMVTGTDRDISLISLAAPMPWEQVEETTVSIPRLEPDRIETRDVVSIVDDSGRESTIGRTGRERADAGVQAVDEIDLTEGPATANQPEATTSGPPATKQKTEPAPIPEPQPFPLKPEPEADSSSSEPLRVLEPGVESGAHKPEQDLSSEKAIPKIAAIQVKEGVVQKASIEEKAAAALEFRLKEKADGKAEATAAHERQDLEPQRHPDKERSSAPRESLPPLEPYVGEGAAFAQQTAPPIQDSVFVSDERSIRSASAEPVGTAPRSGDSTAEWTPLTPPSASAAAPHGWTTADTASAHSATDAGKGTVSAVDVLFGGSEGRASATPSPVFAPRKSRGWMSLALARLRLGVVTFVRSSLATTHSLAVSLLMLTVIGVAGLAVGVGLVGLAWIVMEEQPSNAFHNLSSAPERTVLDPGKNGYLLLLGFDADPSRDPVQAGYERKFTAADLELSKSCAGGDRGTPLAVRSTASASAIASWFRTSDPAALFRNQAGGIGTWLPQYEASLERYRRWLKMPFEDWGYGQLVSPNCSEILAAHRLYVAEGFLETVEAGITRLEGDLTAWRTALAQAKTLPIKMMAADAINDDVAVISGLLTRLDLEEKFVPQLMKMVRPLDQVEQSLRWPMQSQFVIASRASDPGLKQEKPGDRPFYVSIVAAMPLPKQKRLNAYAEYYETAMRNGEGPRAFSPKLYTYVRTPPQSWFDYLLNPIDNVVGLEPLPPWDLYSGRVLETDARLRLASLQAWIKQSPQGVDLLARVAKAGQSFYDPFTGLPMLLSAKKNLLYSVGKDGQDDDGDPRLDVTVLIPRSVPTTSPESRRTAASKSK